MSIRMMRKNISALLLLSLLSACAALVGARARDAGALLAGKYLRATVRMPMPLS
jgi:hypothetical protein